MYVLHTLFFFFFQCYGDHRDLHSFPTRRSSDLVVHGGEVVGGERIEQFVLGDGAGGDHAGDVALDQPQHRQDRKSTRLNSSHRCISYAVFCLKKKKQKTTNTHRTKNTHTLTYYT